MHWPDTDSSLFENLAPHGLLDGFPRLQKSRERGIHALSEPGLPPEQAAVPVDHEHDDNRVRAGKMLSLAGSAFPPPATCGNLRLSAAIGAEAVPVVPVQQALGLRQ